MQGHERNVFDRYMAVQVAASTASVYDTTVVVIRQIVFSLMLTGC